MSGQRKAIIRCLEIGGWKFLKFFGKGSFIDVTAVHDPTGADVAIKVKKRGRLDDWRRVLASITTSTCISTCILWDAITVQELNVKPIKSCLSYLIVGIVENKEFRKDQDSLSKEMDSTETFWSSVPCHKRIRSFRYQNRQRYDW